MASGLIDAELGADVFKKRVPMPGRGKRGGARTIVWNNLDDRWFFLFGFEKSDQESTDERELVALQRIAAALLALDPKLLEHSIAEGELVEICHEKRPSVH